MCDTVSPCWLSILNIGVCTCWSQSPQLSLPFILSPNIRFFKNSNCLLDISSFMFYRLLKHVPKWNGIFFSHLNLFLFLSFLSQWLVLPFPSQKLDIILTHPQLQLLFKIITSSQFSQDFLGFSIKFLHLWKLEWLAWNCPHFKAGSLTSWEPFHLGQTREAGHPFPLIQSVTETHWLSILVCPAVSSLRLHCYCNQYKAFPFLVCCCCCC